MRRVSPFRIELGLSGWLAAIAALVILVVLAGVVAFVSIFLIPALLVTSALFYFRRKRNASQKRGPMSGPPVDEMPVIDAEFRVVDAAEIDGNVKSSDLDKP